MNSKPNKFHKEIVIKSTTDNLSIVRDFVKSTAEQSGFPDAVAGKIVLAVDEACTNIIKHAYKYSPEGKILVDISFHDSKLTISITDEGSHFNPDNIPEPDIQEYYKQRRVGGLGMYLMKKLMDEVKYSTLKDNRNQVVLVKYLS